MFIINNLNYKIFLYLSYVINITTIKQYKGVQLTFEVLGF
jgi:hypothetical protein